MTEELYFIGTIHGGFTKEDELESIIKEEQPNRVLVEMNEQDIINKDIEKYPEEMQFALKYCRKKNISCKGFDAKYMANSREPTAKEEKLAKKMFEEMQQYNDWKHVNSKKGRELLKRFEESLPSTPEDRHREEIMKNNILKLATGKTLVITGAGHLDFFEKNFPKGVFLLK